MAGSAIGSGWLFVAAVALMLAFQLRRMSRLRSATNQALHEIRRPLQALALASPLGAPGGRGARDFPGPGPGRHEQSGVVWQAIRAVGELDRQLNGGGRPPERTELVACRLMVDACIRRWQSRAALSGAKIRLRWAGPDALVRGDGAVLAAALENLLVNAIEHGGPAITVNALIVSKRLRIEVIDSGRKARTCSSEGRSRLAGLAGRQRHGHGLAVVEKAAAGHGGRFDLEVGDAGAKATLILPVNHSGASRAVPVRTRW